MSTGVKWEGLKKMSTTLDVGIRDIYIHKEEEVDVVKRVGMCRMDAFCIQK